jgi:hypothetical protein
MMFNPVRFLAVVLFSLGCAWAGFAAELPPIVTKARAYLGSDAALAGVKSVHYTGTLVTAGNTSAVIEIIFQKPFQQRITATSERAVPAAKAGDPAVVEKTIEITALDDYDAWRRLQDATDSTRWQLTLLDKDQIKRLRANTWENLAYYNHLEQGGVEVKSMGPATVEGVACEKVAFRHADDIVFLRYFDKATGRLVLTETEQGGSIREEGEMIVNGIRFPKKVITTTRENGKELSITVTFEKISVNEVFPETLFAIPELSHK